MTDTSLTIRLGALGDLVLCFRAFASLRRYHAGGRLALLTMPPFVSFARSMPWFDDVLTDPRPSGRSVGAWVKLVGDVRRFAPTRVYDFQGKLRQTVLYAALGGPFGPEWSGAAPGCSHPRLWPPQPGMHYTDFVAAQLDRAGVPLVDTPDLGWLDAPLDGLALPERFAMLIPGCAPGRPYKRWPVEHFAALADRFKADGIGVVAVGTKSDADSVQAIVARAPHVIDLTGKTSLQQVAALARRAEAVIGNDTGPTHLAAAVGGKTLALICEQVNPVWSSPRGPKASWLQGKPLADLGVEAVWCALEA